MLNIGMGAPVARLLGPCLGGPPASAYHPPIQTSHLYGGHFFTPWAIPPPSPMPESHSP
jgi:hypothetical protein